MHNQIGSFVLGGLSVVFAGYGFRELAGAYNADALNAWGNRALPGAGGVLLAALFADMTFRLLG
jgi:hypothetical protein